MGLASGLSASSSSFFDNRSVLASSTGAKTLVRNLALLDFLTLDRRPLAIVEDRICELQKASDAPSESDVAKSFSELSLGVTRNLDLQMDL